MPAMASASLGGAAAGVGKPEVLGAVEEAALSDLLLLLAGGLVATSSAYSMS